MSAKLMIKAGPNSRELKINMSTQEMHKVATELCTDPDYYEDPGVGTKEEE